LLFVLLCLEVLTSECLCRLHRISPRGFSRSPLVSPSRMVVVGRCGSCNGRCFVSSCDCSCLSEIGLFALGRLGDDRVGDGMSMLLVVLVLQIKCGIRIGSSMPPGFGVEKSGVASWRIGHISLEVMILLSPLGSLFWAIVSCLWFGLSRLVMSLENGEGGERIIESELLTQAS
jgi:hypothetical protein